MSKSRNLATLLGSDGSVKTTKYVDEKGGVAEFVASGTLPNGVPVILNSDGTVSHINTIGALESIPKGTETDAGFGNISYTTVAYDPHTPNRVVVTWKDSYHLKIAAGIISGTTVTFGAEVIGVWDMSNGIFGVHFDPVTPNSFLLMYRARSTSYGTMIAGTISGNTVTAGTPTVFASTATNSMDLAFDPSTSGSFVIGAESNTGLKVYAGTLSGTTLTFGTPVTAKTGDDFRDISVAFDSSIAGNYVLSYENTSTYPNVNFEILAGTVSGTTATTGAVTLVQSIGNGGLFDGNQIFSDSNVPGKFIMAYRYGPSYARVCTVSGNTFTFGTAVQISTATPIGSSMRSLYNSSLSSLISTARYNSNFEMTVSTVSGMTITPATPIIVAAGNRSNFSLSFDPFTSGRFIAFYRNQTGSPNYGATLFGQLATVAAPNLTTETADNFIGISSASYADGETATVTLAGSVSENQTGLTTNSTYYVQTDGTLTTSAGTPIVEAGRAISSTSLLLTSEAGADGADGADGIQGIQGIQGAAGLGIQFLGQVATIGDLPASSNTQGDAYIVQADDSLHVWDGTSTWVSGGSIQGPQGIQGSQGNVGAAGSDGVAGSAGTDGATGPAGATGAAGPAGADSTVAGPAGADGAAGVVAPPTRVEFTATENQATKTGLTYTVGNIDCYINGVKMSGSSFTASDGVSVTFTPALSLGEEVQLIMGAAGASGLASTVSTTDPLITSNPSALGHVWVNSTSGMTYVCTDITVDMNIWFNVGLGSLSVSPPFMATGGTITTVGNYKIHTFLTSGTFTPNKDGIVDYLVVAGGGSGGAGGWGAGGGGAGGLQTATGFAISNNNPITVTVGAGGAAAVAAEGVSGSNSVFSTITSIGGGGGAISLDPDGLIGGSGGGGTYNGGNGGSGTSGQGNAGGSNVATYGVGAGGGGASGAGSNSGILKQAGAGGDGSTSILSGSSVTYAGGGGGGTEGQADRTIALGGSGGGGNGGKQNGTVATAGTDNTGSGGGGTGSGAGTLPSGSGGSGIVIIRYAV